MEERSFKCLFVVLAILNLFSTLITAQTIRISPSKSVLMVKEGDPFNLTCIAEYNKNSPQTVSMYKMGVKLNLLRPKAKEDNGVREESRTLVMLSATKDDEGKYECRLEPLGSTSDLQVYVYKLPELENVIISGKPSELNLSCSLSDSDNYNYKVSWVRNNETIEEDPAKYKLGPTSLEILNPTREDMGEYQCAITFHPSEETVIAGSVYVGAPPKIESQSKNPTVSQEDDVSMTCKVSGYPFPTLKWFKDETEMVESDRVRFQEYEGLENGKVILDTVDYDDKGIYACVASNNIEPFNATATMRLKVKDKFAALWPFLGILAEVIVLLAIILWSHKHQKKQSSDDDVDDGDNTESKPLTGGTSSGVRSRNK